MSDESITDSVKDVVKERLKNPLWGYIALSWCGFNWKNLAILFMSKSSVTTRIEQITRSENFYWLYLAAPVALGIVLSVISPYLNYGIAWTKRWLEAKEREGVKKSLIAEYEMQKETAEKKVEALNAEKLAQSVQHTKLVEQEEIAKRDKLKTEALKAEFEQLQNNIAVLKISRDELKIDIESRQEGLESLKDEWRKYTDRTAQIVNLLKYELQTENFSAEEFLKKAKEITEVSITSQLFLRSKTP
ncbi:MULTISPECIES: hypothetical protein [Citrobacter]|uniref:hypothetical protein n=1 Tax=Citrobacter TaxID=544 RepID=UPI002900A2C6|nr:hypothetical protein [Citrobacter sp.]MDU0999467.1 hypothetical protein [Citrobacter sp.]